MKDWNTRHRKKELEKICKEAREKAEKVKLGEERGKIEVDPWKKIRENKTAEVRENDLYYRRLMGLMLRNWGDTLYDWSVANGSKKK